MALLYCSSNAWHGVPFWKVRIMQHHILIKDNAAKYTLTKSHRISFFVGQKTHKRIAQNVRHWLTSPSSIIWDTAAETWGIHISKCGAGNIKHMLTAGQVADSGAHNLRTLLRDFYWNQFITLLRGGIMTKLWWNWMQERIIRPPIALQGIHFFWNCASV